MTIESSVLIQHSGEIAYYTEYISKNNTGGLKGRKNKPKVVSQYENLCMTISLVSKRMFYNTTKINLDPSRIQWNTAPRVSGGFRSLKRRDPKLNECLSESTPKESSKPHPLRCSRGQTTLSHLIL